MKPINEVSNFPGTIIFHTTPNDHISKHGYHRLMIGPAMSSLPHVYWRVNEIATVELIPEAAWRQADQIIKQGHGIAVEWENFAVANAIANHLLKRMRSFFK